MPAIAEPPAYAEVVDFLAAGPSAADILRFTPSAEAQAHISECWRRIAKEI